ncbi:MAG: Hpt domain-containing protein [Nitrospirae bacterium]|nr:Hpt domain-containing protein [Nitrospirota bacterium]
MFKPWLRSPWTLPTITIVLTSGVFAWDLLTPLGLVPWLLYIPILLLTLWMPQRRGAVMAACSFTILIILGAIFSSRRASIEIALFNRFIGIAVLWSTTFLLLWKETLIRQSQEVLEQQIAAQKAILQRTAGRLGQENNEPSAPLSVDPKAWQPILEAQRPGRPDVLAKMLGLYLKDSRELVDMLLAALANQDSKAIQESTHGLKSCSTMMGARRLTSLCDQLEMLRQTQSLDEAATLIPAIREEFSRVCDIFSAELARRTV